ncbi:MAG TPA: LppX_LprAFG lipoprotein, partial [Pseudonocardiaceae bacterium]|nr:LppX_LprAFG lipoprotein [Pseudonocardiaceae bacterium]
MPRRHLRLFALLAALLTALLTSCGGADAGRTDPPPAPLPEGPRLLADSAEAMRQVTSTRVGINVEGELPGVPIKSAEGQLTNEGEA